jgi:hypothetical protein
MGVELLSEAKYESLEAVSVPLLIFLLQSAASYCQPKFLKVERVLTGVPSS